MQTFKIGFRQVFTPLNAENNIGVTFDVIVAYAHEKINILDSVLNIILIFFYDVNLNSQDLYTWTLLSIN